MLVGIFKVMVIVLKILGFNNRAIVLVIIDFGKYSFWNSLIFCLRNLFVRIKIVMVIKVNKILIKLSIMWFY